MKAGVRDKDGNYPPESIYGRVDARLDELAEAVKDYWPIGGN
jgi:hypothetical protein